MRSENFLSMHVFGTRFCQTMALLVKKNEKANAEGKLYTIIDECERIEEYFIFTGNYEHSKMRKSIILWMNRFQRDPFNAHSKPS